VPLVLDEPATLPTPAPVALTDGTHHVMSEFVSYSGVDTGNRQTFYEYPLVQYPSITTECPTFVSFLLRANWATTQAGSVFASFDELYPNNTRTALASQPFRALELSLDRAITVWVPSWWKNCTGRSLFIGTMAATTGTGKFFVRAQSSYLPIVKVPLLQVEAQLTRTSVDGGTVINPIQVGCPVTSPSGLASYRLYDAVHLEAAVMSAREEPIVLRSLLLTLTTSNNVSLGVTDALRFSWGFGDLAESRLLFVVLDTQFDILTDPSQCSVFFHGLWAADGSALETDVTPPLQTKPLASCDSALYSVFRERVLSQGLQVQDNTDVSFINTYIGIVNMMFGSETWRSCEKFVQSMFTVAPVAIDDVTMSCNSGKNPAFCCSVTRTPRVGSVSYMANPAAVRTQCPGVNARCVEQFQSAYSNAVAPENLASCNGPVIDIVAQQTAQKQAFVRCQSSVWGLNFNDSVACQFDPATGRPLPCAVGTCSVFSGKCVFTTAEAELAFLDCLDEELSPIVKYNLHTKVGLTASEPLRNARTFFLKDSCVSRSNFNDWRLMTRTLTGPPSDTTEIHSLTSQFSAGSECPLSDAIHSVGVIGESAACVNAPLFFSNALIISRGQCEAAANCNYKIPQCPNIYPNVPAGNTAACQAACVSIAQQPATCAHCHSSEPCVLVNVSGAVPCEQQHACVSRGSVVAVSDPAECDAIGTCSQPCFDVKCGDAAARDAPGLCVNTSLTAASFSVCRSRGGILANQVCYFPAVNTEATCTAAGLSWIVNECNSLDSATCESCEAGASCPVVATSILKCVSSVFSRPCVDRAECEQNFRCSDRLQVKKWLEITGLPEREYFCSEKKNPAAVLIPCGFGSTSVFPSVSLGAECLLFAEPFFSSQSNTTCAANGARTWRRFARTQAECLSVTRCMEVIPEKLYKGAIFPTTTLYPVSEISHFTSRQGSACSACGGTALPAFTWTAGEWRPSVPVLLSSLAPAFAPYAKWQANGTLDFAKIVSPFLAAMFDASATTYQTYFGCSTPSRIESVTALVGLCQPGNEKALTPLETALSSLRVCKGAETSVTLSALSISFPPESVQQEGCVSFRVSGFSVDAFASPIKNDLMQFYAAKSNDYSAFEAVINDEKFAFGQVVSDGFVLTRDDADDTIQTAGVTICATVDADVPIQERYLSHGWFDFGRRVDTFRVAPLRVPVFRKEIVVAAGQNATEFYCFSVSEQEEFEEIFEQDEPIYLIIVAPKHDSALTVGERSSLYIVGVAYALVAWLFILIQVRMLVLSDRVLALSLLRVFLVLAFVVRAIYFILIANDVILGGTTENLAIGLLPSVFLFSALSCIVIVWSSFAVGRLNKHVSFIIFPAIFIVVNAIVYAIYLALIIAASQVGEESTTQCFGRIRTTNTDAQTAIASSLLVFEMLLAILVATLLVIFAIRLHLLIKKMGMRNRSLLGTALTCAFTYVASCVIMLITAVTSTSPYVCWVLGAIELLPMAVVVVVLSHKPSVDYSKSSSRGSTGPASEVVGISSWRV